MTNRLPHYVCPHCCGELVRDGAILRCTAESLAFPFLDGIPDFVLPERRADVEEYLATYRAVRSCGEWACTSRTAFERLPFASRADRNASVWRLRRRTLQVFLGDLEERFERRTLRILDAGCGNGWLSYRLSRLGHHVVAQDILIDAGDGLATVRDFYGDALPFTPVRAEFDFPPFPPRSFDVIIFNASLHHSSDPRATIVRTMHLLDGNGALYIIDSPEFCNSRDGEMMLSQRAKEFIRRHSINFPSRGKGYLLSGEMERLKSHYAVERRDISFGPAYAARRVVTRVRHRRRAARFPLYVITMESTAC